MSSILGGVFGLLLVLWATIASIDMVQLMTLHNALAFVTQQAVRQESVSGCWTPMTNQVILDTLQQQKLPAADVTVTAYSAAPGAPYGRPVVVSLLVPDQFDILGAKTPLTVQVAVSDTATSQWVPTVGVTSNSACTAPSTLAVAPGAAQPTSGGGPYNGF